MPRQPVARPRTRAPQQLKTGTTSRTASPARRGSSGTPARPTASKQVPGRQARAASNARTHRETTYPAASSRRGVRGVWIALSTVPLVALVGVTVWIGAAGAVRDDPANETFVSGPVTDEPAEVPLTSPGTVAGPEVPAAGAASTGIAEAVDVGWLDSVSAASGVPRRALAAYAGASLRLATEQPGCNLGWTTLAGIGQIESGHASHGGTTLLADGTTDKTIRGPALDGIDFMAIPDTDGGAWDGDATWDRAVGPVQFIPSTWARWGADGNGDGVSDPNQIDDAVLAAGRYLCHSGDLSGVDGWRAAIFSYNHDNSYVDAVAEQANRYARMS